MSKLDQIKAPIADAMNAFEPKFKASMASKVPLLDKVTHYIVKRKGKQMRPMFVFLAAKMFSEITESTYRAASLIELLHTASLVHDDVVDDANMRRGFFSINALWKNKVAVLVGDFMLSKVLLLSVENKEYRLLEISSQAVREMSEGELLQIEKARKLDIVEEVYFEIIRKKTATLIAACCAAGTASVSEDDELVAKMHRFGELIGIAFQIKDDLFDYQSTNKIGKPTGIDIKEQKMTLPLIYTLQQVDKKTKDYVINIIKRHHKNPKKVKEVIDIVNDGGGIDYSKEKMNNYKEEALAILDTMPVNEARESMRALVEYAIDRKK